MGGGITAPQEEPADGIAYIAISASIFTFHTGHSDIIDFQCYYFVKIYSQTCVVFIYSTGISCHPCSFVLQIVAMYITIMNIYLTCGALQ